MVGVYGVGAYSRCVMLGGYDNHTYLIKFCGSSPSHHPRADVLVRSKWMHDNVIVTNGGEAQFKSMTILKSMLRSHAHPDATISALVFICLLTV